MQHALKVPRILFSTFLFCALSPASSKTLTFQTYQECNAQAAKESKEMEKTYAEQSACWVKSRCPNPGADSRFPEWFRQIQSLRKTCDEMRAQENARASDAAAARRARADEATEARRKDAASARESQSANTEARGTGSIHDHNPTVVGTVRQSSGTSVSDEAKQDAVKKYEKQAVDAKKMVDTLGLLRKAYTSPETREKREKSREAARESLPSDALDPNKDTPNAEHFEEAVKTPAEVAEQSILQPVNEVRGTSPVITTVEKEAKDRILQVEGDAYQQFQDTAQQVRDMNTAEGAGGNQPPALLSNGTPDPALRGGDDTPDTSSAVDLTGLPSTREPYVGGPGKYAAEHASAANANAQTRSRVTKDREEGNPAVGAPQPYFGGPEKFERDHASPTALASNARSEEDRPVISEQAHAGNASKPTICQGRQFGVPDSVFNAGTVLTKDAVRYRCKNGQWNVIPH